MGDRCTGACCRRLWLPFSTRAEISSSGWPDAQQIAEMVVPLEDQYLAPDGLPISVSRGIFVTCKNLQPNGDCGIYENRPGMCRDFPDGYSCSCGTLCEWDEARNLPVHPNRPSRELRRAAAEAAKKERRKPSRALAVWNAAEVGERG